MKFILSWVLTALAVSVALFVVPGITAVGTQSTAVFSAALFLALINSSIKPALKLLSLPITVSTFGVFAIIVNAALLECASWLSVNLFGSGIMIDDLASSLLGAIVISVSSAAINALTGNIARA